MIRVKDSVVRDPDRWGQAQALLDRVANPDAQRRQQLRRRQGFRDIRHARRFLTHNPERETSQQGEPT